MASTVRFIPTAVRRLLKGGAFLAVKGVAHGTAAEMRRRVNTPGHGVPSDPGQYPHRQSGDLYDSIYVAEFPDRLSCQVVVAARHGIMLEFGTVNIEARPFMMRTFMWVSHKGLGRYVKGG